MLRIDVDQSKVYINLYDSISNYATSVNLGHFTGLFTGKMIYDSISNYAIFVNLCHLTGLFTGIVIYDAISV
jgi:hypothetical protein